jgi:hypothetical protein
MKDRLRFFVVLAGWVGIALSGTAAWASPSTLKCNSNKDRVWVYDSLANFDIQAKLNCGETVEIIERVKDYVRIRARNGVEGYVPDTEIADVPAFHDPTPDVGTVAKQVQAREIAKVAEAESAFLTAEADSRDSSSASAAAEPAGKDSSRKEATAGGQILAFKALAEMNPRPSSALVRKAAPVAPEAPAMQPIASSSRMLDGSSGAMPDVAEPPTMSNPAPARSAIAASDADDSADFKPEIERSDSACQSYFSAYGLTSSQLKWIAQNREKMFPSVCPAPDPSKVNFVIIFTHDVDFYNATMPEPVHSVNGFSDFRPLTTVDSALVPESGENKAHREYVWIFQFARGSFNPETFSAHRRYQFTKVETNSLGSKAGPKAVEDAFRFVEGANR